MNKLTMLGWVAIFLIAVGSVLGLAVLPADALQGEVQRLLYVHVPVAWVMMLAFFVVFLMSILYLVQRRLKWDLLAVSAAELGVLAAVLTLILGTLWGRPTWGIWWAWDPRVTTTALLVPIYTGYLVVRSMTEDPDRRARWAAVIGLIAFVQVPIVYLSVFWWRSLHQPPSSPQSMWSAYGLVMLLGFVAYTLAFAYLWLRRYRLAATELELELSGPEEG
ncbi:cytochrome c biogenesis protein CcsA [Candidatus Palauibacter polyketidifaciens]|uniref:cytochrome c biogenesis protein CcsA n=1 Tax=Candidatus Palauibacter polyketidifaciens TaxID=3056740 RepID=UPI00238A3603|nr:cytochrome c biogenesis protein CcsA [Candidatus Palauibacter polyketidifaciens]MDE2719965.1 cytochrome c biogenesis protein CcsA [Candidatus Palauibacter polyketidifaciens]